MLDSVLQHTSLRGKEDNSGPNFFKHSGAKKGRTSANYSEAAGMVERIHRQLKTVLTCQEKINWIETLAAVLLGVRAVTKEYLKASPAELVYGSKLRLPVDLFTTNKTIETAFPADFVQRLSTSFQNPRPLPAKHHDKRKVFAHPELQKTSRVLRDDK